MNAALVIMAAGLGSRYGGNKQVDGVGPNGEVLMEYSIHDAIRAGFTKVVFIVKPEILGLVRTLCGDSLRGKTTRSGKPLEVCYAFQDFESLPAFYTLPAGRTKPFGTTHAVLCARDYVNEPFCVINADDYYGVDAYRAMYDELCRLPQSGRATMVGYLLKNTVSLNGTVSRGICRVENGELTYNGHRWDSMSGSEQLKVSTAIVRKLNPNCGFVLIDKLEQMDTETLQDFGTWLEQEGLQAIATRVSTGGECSIIIEDGYVKGEVPQKKEWKAGEF